MVTFDTDVWVPGMTSGARTGRGSASPATLAKETLLMTSGSVLSEFFDDDERDGHLAKRPLTPTSLVTSPTDPAANLSGASGGVTGVRASHDTVRPDGFLRSPASSEESWPASFVRPHHHPPAAPMENGMLPKRPTLLTRILHGEISSLHSPLPSPLPEPLDQRADSPRKDGAGDLPPVAPRLGTPPLLQAPTPQNVARKNHLREMLIRKASVSGHTAGMKKDASGSSCSSSSRSSSPSSDDGQSFAKKYGICERGSIGQGATAVVRLVHKLEHATNSEKYYAVKEFRRRRKEESEREYVKKLAAEFCISSALHHINVIETVDLVQDENQHWCEVMEYCPGGDLYNAIKSGCMTRTEVNCCFKQLIIGVGYLHDMGVAHRDIKPENLLLDATGHLKITDFGVSEVFRMCWEKTAHKSKPGLLGSEPYIAPEIFHSVEYDAREVDVWACGIVYYCMLYQGIPWRMATPKDPGYARYLEQRARRAYEPVERLEEGCRNLMLRVLEPDPSKRITVPEILADSWFRSIPCCSMETEIALAQRDLLASSPTSTIQTHPDPLEVDRASTSPIPARQLSPAPSVPHQSHHHIPDDVLASHLLNRSRRCTPPQ